MQEEFNELPFDGPGGNKEGNEVNGPKGQRIDMDQTNFETSDAKRELVDADKELGSQIDKAATELSENISEVEKDAKKNIEEVKSSLSDKLKDVEQEISDAVKAIDAVTGVDSSSLPTYLKQLKDEFVTNQAEWTKTVQNIEDEDNMTEEEVIATNALKYYGWDFSTPGFLSYLDRGTEANFGTISTEQFEEYSKHVDGLIEGLNDMESEMSELQEKIDVLKAIEDRTPEQEQDLAEAEEEMDSLKVETSKSSKALRRITDVDPLSGEFGVKDQDGCRQYLWDTASSDEQEYRDRLANELVGYGAKAGYYKNLEAGFRAEAETWKMVKAEIADKEANGEELTPKEQAQKFASENFEQKYGFEQHIIAVLTWNEGNDDALGFVVASDNGIYEEYERHFEDLNQSIAELESEVSDLLEQIAELEAIEDRTPEQEEDLVMLREEADAKKMMLSDKSSELFRISSADDVDETKRVVSQAGSFAYYSDLQDADTKSYREQQSHMIGFESPSEEVSKVKEELESRIKQSEEIINDSENYEAEEVEAAKRFITAVGTNVTVVSLSTYQDIVHEEEKAAAEAREAIRLAETFNSMADEIAAQAKTYSFRNLNVYPLPNGEAIEFTIENPEGLVFEILKVDVNGITQTEGKQVIFGEGSITMAPGILLERGDSIDVVVKVEGSVEIKPVEPKFGEYEFPGDSTCIARDAILTSMKKAKTSLVESKDGLNSDNEGFSSKTQFYTSEQVDFEQSMKDAEADIEDNEKELSEAIEELDNVSDVIDNKSDSIEDKEGLINQNQTTVNNNISLVSSHTSQIEVKNAEILELEADPYPDTEKIESLKDEIKSMEEDIADAEKENEDLIKVIDEDTQVLAELKKDLAELQNTSSELEEQIATINHKVAALKDDRLFYEGVIRVITLNLAIYTKAIESTTEAMVQVQKEIDEASTSIEDYTKESDRLGCGEK